MEFEDIVKLPATYDLSSEPTPNDDDSRDYLKYVEGFSVSEVVIKGIDSEWKLYRAISFNVFQVNGIWKFRAETGYLDPGFEPQSTCTITTTFATKGWLGGKVLFTKLSLYNMTLKLSKLSGSHNNGLKVVYEGTDIRHNSTAPVGLLEVTSIGSKEVLTSWPLHRTPLY